MEPHLAPWACRSSQAVRRRPGEPDVLSPGFVRDVNRILGCRIYNRYADKTQVFSLYRNDDITRRMQHVQMVSRIGRTIGRLLGLNEDLIEAIALGHDIGHTPFGHAGERFLSELYFERTGLHFRHNVQSVRFLDRVLGLNISVQTLDGILCHNGLPIRGSIRPETFPEGKDAALEAFDRKYAQACSGSGRSSLVASTLEGCVVRLSDVLAYLEKDREDARLLGIDAAGQDSAGLLGSGRGFAARIVENLVEKSFGRPYLHLDDLYADAIEREKQTNYERIYARQNEQEPYPQLGRMFRDLYSRCREDLACGREKTPVFRHHLKMAGSRDAMQEYLQDGPDLLTVDYIASMTDDYFIDLYEHLFPGRMHLEYRSYFAAADVQGENPKDKVR
ncbi:MAG: HD domain-containing protein [Clostridia bacterium]|nr:HD domain-containing protein [Clostridia bacterium]